MNTAARGAEKLLQAAVLVPPASFPRSRSYHRRNMNQTCSACSSLTVHEARRTSGEEATCSLAGAGKSAAVEEEQAPMMLACAERQQLTT